MTLPGRRHAARALLALAGGASLPGCAYRSLPFVDYQPSLFRVRADSAPTCAWLFGSIHIGLSRFYPLPDAVEQAWQSSRRLACEINTSQNWDRLRDAFRARALLPDGKSLDHFIDEPTLTALRHHFGMGRYEWQSRLRLRPRRVAFLGLGVMGYPMAGHLARAGHRSPSTTAPPPRPTAWVAEHGGGRRPTPREAAAGAEFVFACVGNDDDLRSVVLGPDGALCRHGRRRGLRRPHHRLGRSGARAARRGARAGACISSMRRCPAGRPARSTACSP
jgi:hypothetical protein